ncbi:conserved hypothetical protein [Deferribacter desulfuricans SSM1]|uniref:Twin-arginine translocation signal domain-containing protein n=1 Tax=Deferribacter desulfuricans (strain DSM 14783 / JCM 11476 / NBRC 101012 / SSM1) TaxID=639282 RepID=D3PDX2_DEFDS|nr:twin-arginine translocation signal domain-containing protein [Deferribacter desulfuricans]BAI80795.1 conserved hypothetical protein [Deferribacter desulfuricans SSM1]
MKPKKSRREFLKLGALATVGAVTVLKGKKLMARSVDTAESEILYRETEDFKKYYASLRD